MSNATRTLGGHVSYSVNATGVDDLQMTAKFASDNNMRLVIRNTGNDILGNSTSTHALAIWTNDMNDIELIDSYVGSVYIGPAIKVGACVESIEAHTFANSHKSMIVGGNCPIVGIAGGYTQSDGHGHPPSECSLSADQVLDWEAVTASGKLVTANADSHQDLFWVLRGGGSGLYGVVVSMTIKALPDNFFSMAYVSVMKNGNNAGALCTAVGTSLQILSSLVDAGAFVVWVAGPSGFMIMPAIAPDHHQEDLGHLLEPFLTKLDELRLDHRYSSYEKATFLDNYNAQTASWNVSDYNLSGSLIPRSLLTENSEQLLEATRFISSQTLISSVNYNVTKGVSSPDEVAINPYFRETPMSIALGTPIDYADWNTALTGQDHISSFFLTKLAEIMPFGAAYLSEADFQAADFKALFCGLHYNRFDKIEGQFDPKDLFYAKTAVGNDRWAENGEGRLCRV